MAGSWRRARWRSLPLLGILLLGAAQVGAQETCLKLVFGRYCLGGDVNLLLGQGPQPEFQQADGERLALIFTEGPERVYVLAFRGRIYKVVRRYRAATQLRYEDLYALLREKYGAGEDRSRFPPYATTASRKLSSIRRGDGRAVHYWKPTDTWHVELSWTREMRLALAYIATDLAEQQQAAVDQGF
ncbi:MAG: hypothetical protein U9Q81_08095 [Pseudomonadota bacterium]|nr:hypothetical protein [Pseudomonadota bacterium]